MSSTHITAQHESTLHAILETADPQVSFQESELKDCKDCQVQFQQLTFLRAALDLAGKEVQTGMEDAKSTPSPLPAGHVQKTLGAPGVSKPNRGPIFPWILAMVATAAALMMYLQPNQLPPTHVAPDMTVMGDETGILSASASGVRWTPDASPEASYVVTLRDAQGSERVLHKSAILRGECNYAIDAGTVAWEGVTEFYWEIAVSPQRVNNPSRFILSETLHR